MNRLIKSEFYRIRRSSHFTMWILMVTFLTFAVPVIAISLTCMENKYNVANFVQCYMANSGTLTFMLVSMLAATVAVMPYNYKTSNYMVITGNSIHKILISNMVTLLVSIILPLMVAFAALTGIFYAMGGMGDISGNELVKKWVLVFIGLAHLIIVSGMISGVVRHIVAVGAVLVRWELVDIILPMVLYLWLGDKSKVAADSYNWMVSTVFTNEELAFSTVDSKLIIYQLLALVIEVALWYVVLCVKHRKRNY